MEKTAFSMSIKALLVLGALSMGASEALAQFLGVSFQVLPTTAKIKSTDLVRASASAFGDPGPFTYRFGYMAGGDTTWGPETATASWTVNSARAPLFTPGSMVTFFVHVTSASMAEGWSSASRTVNCPPSGGTLTVTPSIGRPYDTVFTMTASGWTDADDGPSALHYQFGYYKADGSKVMLTTVRSQSTFSGTLPLGPLPGDQMDVFVQVRDVMVDTVTVVRRITVSSAPMPVELQKFSAEAQERNIWLSWRTATETDNFGFVIEHRESADDAWKTIGSVPGHGTTSAPQTYGFLHAAPRAGMHLYRLKQIDRDGEYAYSEERSVRLALAARFGLAQNYPNPFNPSTTISFELPEKAFVSLKIFDVLGREASVLACEELPAGTYSRQWNAAGVAGGVYFCRLRAGDFTETKKLLLLD